MWQKKFISYEWDAIAGILTAVAAIVLHHLHLLDDRVVMPVFLGLMALLFINFMRHSRNNELTAEKVAHAERMLEGMQEALRPAEVALIGPRRLRSENERFARTMRGDTLWYNVCLSMYAPEPIFDALLRPAIENPQVDSIQFVLDTAQRPLWEQTIQARIMACPGHDKVRPPRWRSLPRNVSFIMADGEAGVPRRCSASGASRSCRKRPGAAFRASFSMSGRAPNCCRTWSSWRAPRRNSR